MNSRVFKSKNGIELIVKNRKSAVFFEILGHGHYQAVLEFTSLKFENFITHLEDISNKAWDNFTPKEADSFGSDYYEYYDKEFDNNGYLTIRDDWIFIERPSLDSPRFYKFNKRKMESFLCDLKK
ncbi:hypothetical protein [Cytobacillus horneckiae]|uniref:hypothetical protein n=1 Tax=Cytobacillus horneckiae TaxID=549687 RepID=UPI003D1F687B